MKQSNVTRAALYLRLSRDDETNGDSESIQTQRMMLIEYAKEQGFIVVGEYIDDGWSGTNFNRPGFQRMIDDIENGKINCVITKDLSRLGRNYILTGQYTEIYFPSKGVRYIAINDNVDTQKGDNELAPFLNILNEMHARQTSKKIKTAKLARLKSGQYLTTVPPYGYIKDPTKKNHLIIDPETSPVVKRIFDLCCQGYGRATIARMFSDEKIPNPSWIAYHRYGAFSNIYGESEENKYNWERSHVGEMLHDEVYIGNTTGLKSSRESFKTKHRSKNSVKDWLVIEHTHEAIVSKEIFDKAQSAISIRTKVIKKWDEDIFVGLLFCPDCGRRFIRGCNIRASGKQAYHYCCGTYHQYGSSKCSNHYISYDNIYGIVFSRIKKILSYVDVNNDEFIQDIISSNKSDQQTQITSTRNELKRLDKRLSELDNMFIKLYNDWGQGTISEHNFSLMSEKLQSEQESIKEKVQSLNASLKDHDESCDNVAQWIEAARHFVKPTELTRELLTSLVDKIYIHQPVVNEDNTKTQDIDIHYKFIGNIMSFHNEV